MAQRFTNTLGFKEIIIQDLSEALAVLTIIKDRNPLIQLTTDEEAVGYAGVLYFQNIEKTLKKEGLLQPLIYDCGSLTGFALEALYQRCRIIGFEGSPQATQKLKSIANQLESLILTPSERSTRKFVVRHHSRLEKDLLDFIAL